MRSSMTFPIFELPAWNGAAISVSSKKKGDPDGISPNRTRASRENQVDVSGCAKALPDIVPLKFRSRVGFTK